MDMKDLTALPAADRARELAHAREKLRRLRFEAAQGKLAKVRQIRDVRATIARLQTLAARDAAGAR